MNQGPSAAKTTCAKFWKLIAKTRNLRQSTPARPSASPQALSTRHSPEKVENALVLAAVRRMIRPADAPPLATVRSLAYFLPVIEEVLETEVGEEYFQYARQKLQRLRTS